MTVYYIIMIMPKIVNHEARRLAFASAAKEVIAAKDIASVRLVDVARAAGVTTGSLGHYFDDKDELLDAALEQLVADWDANLKTSEGPLVDTLAQFLPLDVESSRNCRVWFAFFSRSLVSDAVAKKMTRYWGRYHSRLAKHLHDREGRSREDAEILTDTIMAVVDGMVLRAISDPTRWPASRQRAQLEAALLQLVGPSAITQTAKTDAKKANSAKTAEADRRGV